MTHLLRLSAGLLLAIPPRQSAAQAPTRFELPNGLRVWVQEDHTRPVALVQVAYKVGAINEAPGTTGTAHYVEHMVYRATEHIRNEDNYGYNDRIGGRWTGGTSRDGTTYGETVPSWALEAALRTTAERMGRTVFDSVEFERERNNVVTEANGFSRSDPATALRDAVMLASFDIHPYRYTSTTWSQDNLVISRNDARDYYRRYYGPNNAVLTVVGDVAPAEVRRLVTLHFASLARAPHSGAVTAIEPPQRAEKRLTLRAPTDRAQMELVYRAPQASHRDYAVLAVLDRILTRRIRAALPAGLGADLTTTHAATPYPFVYRIAATAGSDVDLERVLATIQSEIERLATGGVSEAELVSARVEPPPQGGRGRGGAGAAEAQGGAVPPRQSNLTQIAAQLTSREVFPWEVGADARDAIRRAQTTVTSADVAAYVDRWLRVSQRTVGFLIPGTDDFMPAWSNGRALAGQRLEVPPLTTPPAKRARPEPVPPRALQPLGKLALEPRRATLANGVVVRVAHMSGTTTTLALRIAFGNERDPAGKDGLSLLAARLVAGDLALQALSARATMTTLANDGYFDIRVSGTPATVPSMLEAAARALRARDFTEAQVEAEAARPVRAATGGRGGGRGAGVTADARARVLSAVAPDWISTDPAPSPSLTASDVNSYLAQHLGGAAVTVALVGPASAAELSRAAAQAFTSFPSGPRALRARGGRATPLNDAREERIALASETQVTVLAGLPGVARDDPDARALELLNYIVGVPSYGGRLGWALTKVGLTYSSAATTTTAASTGHILISTKCDTRNLDATIQAIREVVAGVGENGVEQWELREAQAFTLGRTLLYGPREDSGQDAIATALLDSESGGSELLDLPALSRGYLGVTLQQVNAAARKHYRPDLLKVAAIGAVPSGEPSRIFPPGTFKALFQP